MPGMNGRGAGGTEERVALYLRVSSEEQRETVDIQCEFLEQYCGLYGLEVAGIYEGDGISGKVPMAERPEGRRLLNDAKAGEFGTVLVSKLDRLGRSLLVIVDAHDRLADAGAALRSGREPIDTSNPSGRLIFQMLASFAEYDRENIAERTQAGLRRAFRKGTQLGCIPFGYDVNEVNLGGGFVVVEEEARIVREIVANVAGGPPSTPRRSASTTRASLLPGASTGAGRESTGPPGATRPCGASSPKAPTAASTS